MQEPTFKEELERQMERKQKEEVKEEGMAKERVVLRKYNEQILER